MITRRRLLQAAAALPALDCLGPGTDSAQAADAGAEDLTRYVKISIGTGGHGHTYPGATCPFGMVQLSPDTFNDDWDWCSGYHASDSSIMGFSHTHLSGTGCGDMLDVLVMPGTGAAKTLPGSREHPEEGYRSRFSHADEAATPGYYSVLLRDYAIRAELTATDRAGIHKYTFPKSDTSHFIVDLFHHYGNGPREVRSADLKVTSPDTIAGGRTVHQWAKGRQIYFAMKFSKPFLSGDIVNDGPGPKCLLRYQTAQDEVIYVKTGISAVSVEGALKNLEAEIPDWNFDRVRERARQAWQRELSRVRIETSNPKHREIFYTALYHTMLAPTLFDDVDGQYRGMDGKLQTLAPGAHNYSTFSLWDTYRAAHPLYTLTQRERVPDLVNCLIRMATESPLGLPVWPLQGVETSCMTGYHSVVVIAEAAEKGFAGIDFKRVYPVVKRRVMADDYQGLALYRKMGYIPCDLVEESASKALDYCYDDWAAARIARAAGAEEDARLLAERSKSYRNLFDKKIRFMRPRLQNGEWASPFDPKEISIMKKWRDFTESNAWQATFANQHDLKGYIELFGGREAFMAQLDALFAQSTDLPPDTPPDVAGLVGMYAHGNEPSHHIAYLYCYAGAPWKTQERVRSLLETMYRDEPDGVAGNEDCGQISAWYVISALGFYAVDPVSGNYVFGTPLFNRAVVEMGPGSTLTVEAKRQSPEDCYIQSVTFNGKPYHKVWFRHADIARGGTLVFQMGPRPNRQFGADDAAAPPSLTP
ncbi:MAG: GH92 family glycosyl hydrolase [Bryobacteraceae bacterium]